LLWGGITSSRRIDGSSLKISLPHDSTGRQNSRPPSFHSPSGASRGLAAGPRAKEKRTKREIPFSLTKMDGKATELWRRRHLEWRKSRAICNQATKRKERRRKKEVSTSLSLGWDARHTKMLLRPKIRSSAVMSGRSTSSRGTIRSVTTLTELPVEITSMYLTICGCLTAFAF